MKSGEWTLAEKGVRIINVDSVSPTEAPWGTLRILFDREKGIVKDASLHIHITEVKPGVRHEPHIHDHDEIIFVLEGKASEHSPLGPIEVGPGQVIYVPAGVEHGTGNAGDGILKLIVIFPTETMPKDKHR